MPRHAATIAGLLALAALLAGCGQGDDAERRARLGLPDPAYQPLSDRGAALFGQHCRDCHGPGARGTDKGPPLIHPYYVPGHHGDYAFYMAVKNGVVQHHWQFGDMPAQPQVNPEQAADIIAYVRAIQEREGLR